MKLLGSHIQELAFSLSPRWGSRMAAADKTRRGSVRICVSNQWCDVQTEHPVHIVLWKLSSHCRSAGFLISRGNSARPFCSCCLSSHFTSGKHLILIPLLSWLETSAHANYQIGQFYHCRTFSLAVAPQMPAEKGEKSQEGSSGRSSAGRIRRCRVHRRASSVIRDSSRPHQEPRLRADSVLKLITISLINQLLLTLWCGVPVLFLACVVFSIGYCECM